jgi:membrane protein DedA with SNARE-associated domain
MHRALEFLVRHGYVVLPCWVFVEQMGVPVPTVPLLLAAGTLAATGRISFGTAIVLCILPAVCADSIWYWMGRTQGVKILRYLCKISLEPDSCVRRTEGLFSRQGARSLLVAKFVPGLGTVAPPLAGIVQMRPHRFLLFDTGGATLWATAFLGAGYVFAGEIERFAQYAFSLGKGLSALIIGALAAYIAYKLIARQRFLRELRIARISVDELKRKIDAGEELVIVDLRHSVDFEANPETIPGALHLDAQTLENHDELPRDRDVILYCT